MDGEVNQELLKKIIVSIVPFVLKLLNISYSDFILEKRFPDFLPCNYVFKNEWIMWYELLLVKKNIYI